MVATGGKILKKGLSNADLVYKSGEKAFKAIPGKGGVIGTARREYATNLLNRYQSIYGSRGLLTKVSRTSNGQTGILDVWDTTNNVIYDWKFGAKAYMSQRQFMMYGEAYSQ